MKSLKRSDHSYRWCADRVVLFFYSIPLINSIISVRQRVLTIASDSIFYFHEIGAHRLSWSSGWPACTPQSYSPRLSDYVTMPFVPWKSVQLQFLRGTYVRSTPPYPPCSLPTPIHTYVRSVERPDLYRGISGIRTTGCFIYLFEKSVRENCF